MKRRGDKRLRAIIGSAKDEIIPVSLYNCSQQDTILSLAYCNSFSVSSGRLIISFRNFSVPTRKAAKVKHEPRPVSIMYVSPHLSCNFLKASNKMGRRPSLWMSTIFLPSNSSYEVIAGPSTWDTLFKGKAKGTPKASAMPRNPIPIPILSAP